MLVHSKSDLFYGARVRLSDGRLAEVEDNHPNHEKVIVKIGEDTCDVYVGETIDGELYVAELLPGQSEDPPQDTPKPVDPLDVIFDGHDPHTFDGDVLDLI